MILLLCLYIRIPSHITHVAVSNNLLTVAVLGNTIYRFDIKEAKPPESKLKRRHTLYFPYFLSV